MGYYVLTFLVGSAFGVVACLIYWPWKDYP